MDLTVVIVNYNTGSLLTQAIGDLQRAAPRLTMRIVIVDNSSRDDSVALIGRQFPGCHLIANQANIGFGRANNQALKEIAGRYVLLLNADAFVAPDSLEKALAYMDVHPRCGILGARLLSRDGSQQPSARYFPTPWALFLDRTNLVRWFKPFQTIDDMNWDHASVRQCDWVPGCFYLVRRELIDEVGLFDPRYFLYYEEIDHCLAAKRAGWEVTFFPETQVVHLGGESAKSEGEVSARGNQIAALKLESELLYFRKNHGLAATLATVALTTLGEAIVAAKRLLRHRRPSGLGKHAAHAGLAWLLFFRTRMGTRPTR